MKYEQDVEVLEWPHNTCFSRDSYSHGALGSWVHRLVTAHACMLPQQLTASADECTTPEYNSHRLDQAHVEFGHVQRLSQLIIEES